MPLTNYKFNPGDKWPAENASSIDPDTFAGQAVAQLIGGTSPSATGVFDTLGQGANNGKVGLNIDGVAYGDIAVDLIKAGASSEKIAQNTNDGGDWIGPSAWWSQTFTIPAGMNLLTDFRITITKNGSPSGILTATLRTGNTPGAGTIVQSFVIPNGTASGLYTCTLTSPRAVAQNDLFNITLTYTGGTPEWAVQYSQLGGYAGGTSSKNGVADSKDWCFKVFGASYEAHTTATIATALQTAIRLATSALETVAYSTNKYVISGATSGRGHSILKLTTPASGADISGSGATKYYDLGSGATEVSSDGAEYFLARMGSGGKLPSSIVPGLSLISTQEITSGNLTVPAGTTTIIITVIGKLNSSGLVKLAGEVMLIVGIKTDGRIATDGIDGLAVQCGVTFSLSGSTITCTYDPEGGKIDVLTVKAYYLG